MKGIVEVFLMMNHIGFIAHSPATANSLYPLISEIRALSGVELHLYAYHDYVAGLWDVSKSEFYGEYPMELAGMDLIVYGTGSSNPIELNVPQFCSEHGITSIAIHDIFWGELEANAARYINPPDILVVPNEETKEALARVVNMPIEHILPIGNPHFDRLADYVKAYKVNLPISVAFFSQCSTVDDYSETHETSKQALLGLLEFNKVYPHYIDKLYVTAHPRECDTWLKEQLVADNVEYVTNGGTELMLNADVAYGYACTLQYEAQMIGKPVVFYKDVPNLYADMLNISKYQAPSTAHSFDSTSKCLSLIQGILQGNK